jgi:hypothetical protein
LCCRIYIYNEFPASLTRGGYQHPSEIARGEILTGYPKSVLSFLLLACRNLSSEREGEK